MGAPLSPSPRLNWLLVAVCWLVAAAILTGIAINGSANGPLFTDTDDAMRLVNVRDFIAGQGWYDHSQPRLNVPYGAEMHWSRLIDVPIAGLILLFQPLVGDAAAIIAAFAWPLILLFVLLAVLARLTLRLVGPEGVLAALVLPIVTPVVIAQFLPGRLDHHSVQIILTVLMVWCTIEALDRPRWAIAAGLAAATAIAIGGESVPCIAATVMAFGLMWVFRPERADALVMFGLSFAIGTALHLAIAWPPARWFEPACDTISFVYAAVAAGVGLAFVVLAVLPLARAHTLVRLAAGVVAGGMVLGAVVIAFPHCLAGPFAELDPWLTEMWASRIVEGRPIWVSVFELPDLIVATALPLFLAVLVAAYRIIRGGEGRGQWLVYGLFLAVTVVVTIVMVRGGRIAGIVAVPPGAWLIAAARARYLRTRSVLAIGGLLGSWVGFAGLIVMAGIAVGTMLVSGASSATDEAGAVSDRACMMADAFDELAALPAQRVMAPVDLGAHILAYTHHSAVGAPYPRNFQRNAEGLRDAFVFFNAPPVEGREMLLARGITLVVSCVAMVRKQENETTAPDSLAVMLRDGRVPEWLHELSTPGATLRIFAVAQEP